MRTVENHRPAQNSPTDRDFHISSVMPLPGDARPKGEEFSLVRIFGAREKSTTGKIAMGIIDKMKLSPDKSTVIYFYYLWLDNPQKAFLRIKELTGEIREDIVERVVNRVNENDTLTKQYSRFNKIYIRDTERYRRQQLAALLREGVPLEIAAEEAEIRLSSAVIIERGLNEETREADLEAERKFFLAHPEVLRVFKQKQEKLNHEQIAINMGKSIRDINRLTRALIFLGKIQPRPEFEDKVGEQDVLLHEIIRLRNVRGLGNQEIAGELNVPVKRINRAASFLIWMGLIKPLGMSEVNIKKSDRKAHEILLAKYLSLLPSGNTFSVRRMYIDFCQEHGLKMSYPRFSRMYYAVKPGSSATV